MHVWHMCLVTLFRSPEAPHLLWGGGGDLLEEMCKPWILQGAHRERDPYPHRPQDVWGKAAL